MAVAPYRILKLDLQRYPHIGISDMSCIGIVVKVDIYTCHAVQKYFTCQHLFTLFYCLNDNPASRGELTASWFTPGQLISIQLFVDSQLSRRGNG